MLCKHCGKENPDHLSSCAYCGKPIQGEQAPAPCIEIIPPTFAPGSPPPETNAAPEAEAKDEASPKPIHKTSFRKKPILFSIIALILLVAITTGLLTNWLGYYGPSTKIALAAKRTIKSGSFSANVTITVGRLTLKNLTVKAIIDADNEDLTVVCTNKNSIIQFAIYDGYYLERSGLGRYKATDIRHQVDRFFSHKETNWEDLLRTLSPELHDTLAPQMDFDKVDKCMTSLFRKSNSPTWLKETANLTTTKEQGITTYQYRPDTTPLAKSCLECFRPAFHDSGDYDALLKDWDETLEQLPPIDLDFTVEKRQLTGCRVSTEISGKAVTLTTKLSGIGNTSISKQTLQEYLDKAKGK